MKPIGLTHLKSYKDTFDGIYRAKVESNTDASQLGRIKARVYPMFANVLVEDLPWAIPMYPIWEGAGSGIGYFAVPDVGTYVYVMFEQGDIYQPIYIGEAPTGTMGLPASRTTNYPNRKVLKTSSGIEVIVDDTAQHIRINHPTGTYALIDTAGKVTVSSINDVSITAARDINITAVNNLTILGEQTTDVHLVGPADIHADDTLTIRSASAVNINP